MKLFSAIRLYIHLFWQVKKQEKYLRDTIEPIIQPYFDANDGSLDESDWNKIMRYYAWGVPVFLGTFFSIINSKSISQTEHYILSLLGAITGLADDFFDKSKTDKHTIEQLFLEPEKIKGANKNQELFLMLYINALQKSKNSHNIKLKMKDVFDAQLKSQRQESQNINIKELEEICYSKGASSVLFFRASLSKDLIPNEVQALEKLGALIQLGNDIFDVYKDHKAGIKTTATSQSATQQHKQYQQWEKSFIQSIKDLNISQKQKIKGLNFILFGFSRVHVCLEQFKKLEKKHKHFNIEKYNRSQLICDMEKPINILKSVKYFIQLKY